MMSSNNTPPAALYESVWLDANRFYDAERQYYEVSLDELRKRKNPGQHSSSGLSRSSLASEIAIARQKIQKYLKSGDSGIESSKVSVINRIENVEKEQITMKEKLEKLTSEMCEVLAKLTVIDQFLKQQSMLIKDAAEVPKIEAKGNIQNGSSANADEDDLDLFGSEEENEEEKKLKEERLQAYANKKAKKPALVAKSSVVLDVKPWDDETDMKAMETAVRAIETDGLVWGASKLVPLAFGIKKLQIVAIVEDEKVSVDWLQEMISGNEELVQSVDIAAFNKL